ncbi:hypothetical protein Taro_050741 [Colocasia esculenta]|uniref:CCHC-type domain-containing protein n=1 Tax=Colocasia esculenta TaxID=4460 RepID=A0A843XE60_COLES|nr:hypothetical protein [Colocasia esculenta]
MADDRQMEPRRSPPREPTLSEMMQALMGRLDQMEQSTQEHLGQVDQRIVTLQGRVDVIEVAPQGHHPVPPHLPAPQAIEHNDPPQGARRAPRVEDRRAWTPETEDDVFEEVYDHHRRSAPRRGQHADFRRGHDPRYEPQRYHEYEDRDDQIVRSVRVDVPTFDGSLDPKVYLDWEAAMDRYFEWYEMTDGRRVRFAKMKLLGQAQTYWVNVESLLMQRHQDRIETWDDMKAKLREKYLPATCRQRLIDRWQSLTQGSRPVSEYIAEFDEYLLRCGVHEESAMTLSRFRKGLRPIYQRELFRRNVTTLEYAYQVAQEVELFESEYQPPSHVRPTFLRTSDQRTQSAPPQRGQLGAHQETIRQEPTGLRPRLPPPRDQPLPLPAPPSRPQGPFPPARRDEKGKSFVGGESSQRGGARQQCYRCSGFGHFAGQCPTRSMYMGDIEWDTPVIEEVVYEPDPALVEAFHVDSEPIDAS